MSGVKYYDSPDSSYPYVTISTLEVIRYHICTTLYPSEDYADSKKRFILADFDDSGIGKAVKASSNVFNSMEGKFPITAYDISDVEERKEDTTMFEKRGEYYSEHFESYIKSIPLEWTISMMSMFTTAEDYWHAMTLLVDVSSKLERISVPITINGKLDYFYATLTMEPRKGSLAFAREEQKIQGDIFDIEHNIIVKLRAIIIPDTIIYPIDNIVIGLSNPETGMELQAILDLNS